MFKYLTIKRVYLLLIILLVSATSCKEDLCEKGISIFCESYNPTPGKFTEKSLGPDGEANVSFSIGNKGYSGTGGIGFPPTDGGNNLFSMYNPAINQWDSIAPLPAEGRFDAVGFGTSTVGYVGGGYNIRPGTGGTEQVEFKDFYEYNPQTNKWIKKADLPGEPGVYKGFAIGNKGYVLQGKHLWEYNHAADDWIAKASPPVEPNLAFSTTTKGYIVQEKAFWEYNPHTDKWTEKAASPISALGSIGLGIANKGYIIGEEQTWEYNSATNNWFRKADTPEIADANNEGTRLYLEDGFAIGNKAYFGIYYRTFADSFYEFDPSK